eukprot:m.251671 g.251671  ORF g.251671 m.251671 type:complete len:157 (+) comp40338_c0_seq3:179-649(+)
MDPAAFSLFSSAPGNTRRLEKSRFSLLERRRKRKRLFRLFFLCSASLATIFGLVATTSGRRLWMSPRLPCFWDCICWATFDEDEWKRNFRINKRTFIYICQKLKTIDSTTRYENEESNQCGEEGGYYAMVLGLNGGVPDNSVPLWSWKIDGLQHHQ